MKANFEAMAKRTPATVSPAEQVAINTVLAAGEKHGYGNMISWLQTAWTKSQMDAYRWTEKQARNASCGGSGYPLDWVK